MTHFLLLPRNHHLNNILLSGVGLAVAAAATAGVGLVGGGCATDTIASSHDKNDGDEQQRLRNTKSSTNSSTFLRNTRSGTWKKEDPDPIAPPLLLTMRLLRHHDDDCFYQWPLLSAILATATTRIRTTAAEEQNEPQQQRQQHKKKNSQSSRIIFLGTGSSMGCPRPLCAMMFSPRAPQQETRRRGGGGGGGGDSGTTINSSTNTSTSRQQLYESCTISNLALQPGMDPRYNKNYRNNPSLLIQYYPHQPDDHDDTDSYDDHDVQTAADNKNNCTSSDNDHASAKVHPEDVVVNDNDNIDDNNNNDMIVLIDAGKTFREGTLRWLPDLGISHIDAIVLTHHHMDAAAGLDDVRGFQYYHYPTTSSSASTSTTTAAASATTTTSVTTKATASSSTIGTPVITPMPLYLSQYCLDDLQERFPWLLPKIQTEKPPPTTAASLSSSLEKDLPSTINSSTAPSSLASPIIVQRHVATFDVHVVEGLKPFTITSKAVVNKESNAKEDIAATISAAVHRRRRRCRHRPATTHSLKIIPLPVMHGEDLVCMGYAFSLGPQMNVVYLSDISRMIPETLQFIQQQLPPTDILVLDALHPTKTNPVHYSLEQAVLLSHEIQAKQVYLVGMNCDSFLPHEEMNRQLLQQHGNIQLAHDGLAIEATSNGRTVVP